MCIEGLFRLHIKNKRRSVILVTLEPDDGVCMQTANTNGTDGAIYYLAPMTERAHFYEDGPPPGKPVTNMRFAPRGMRILNGRLAAQGASLDVEGFTFLRHETGMPDFHDEDAIRRLYYREVEALVAEVTGARRVVVFDHTLRRRMPEEDDRRDNMRLPAMHVHVDFTPASAEQRVRDVLPDEADRLLKHRVEFVNVWRPIAKPVFDAPLAMCDARSVAAADLVPASLIYNDRVGEIYYVTYNPRHRWIYYPVMQPNEVLLLKNYDSLNDGRARCAPHSAFLDPASPNGSPPRQSIEVRTIAFHAD
jgi:hypothetical protein